MHIIWPMKLTRVLGSDYVKITVDYPLAAAKAFSTLHDPFKFVYVSGEGASTTPGMFTQYSGVIKGRAEVALLQLGNGDPRLKMYSVRPGGVDASAHTEIHQYLPMQHNFLKRVLMALVPPFRAIAPSLLSPTRELGKVLTELAMGDGKPLEGLGIEGDGRIVTNKGRRNYRSLTVLKVSKLSGHGRYLWFCIDSISFTINSLDFHRRQR
jgi:hypothetical protein